MVGMCPGETSISVGWIGCGGLGAWGINSESGFDLSD